jgi:hypothetical protein
VWKKHALRDKNVGGYEEHERRHKHSDPGVVWPWGTRRATPKNEAKSLWCKD